ncbi:hypothetical protein D3C73_1024270 [compost metagenome]
MHRAGPGEDARIVVECGIDIGLVGYRLDHCPHQEGQEGQFRLVGLARIVHRRAQLLQRCYVDLFHIGDVRNARGGKRHLFCDAAAKAGELDLLLRGLSGKTLLRGWGLLAMGKELLDILAQDASGRTRSA